MKKMKRWFALLACLVMAVGAFGVANIANAVDTDGVYTSKQVTPVTDAQGNVTGYKVRLESWVTGTVQSVTSTAPLDIVLVLDQSSSMAYNFSGEATENVTETRQYAMQQAVNSFIGEVAGKYQAENSDHRIALVTFGDSAATLAGWTSVDAAGAAMLQVSINGLPSAPTGLTNVSAGMTLAKQLTVDNYSYSGTNKTDRQKIVILFTDGVPTNSSDDKNFDTALANNALSASSNMKKNGVTVYSIGIFNGAEPSQMYGDAWTYTLLTGLDLQCNGKVGEYWGGSWLQSIIGQNDFAVIDIAAGNRFLNLLSSNFGSIEDVGVERGRHDPYDSRFGTTSGTGYIITIEYNLSTTGYYKTASNASELGTIFTEISRDIETVSSDLGAQAYIADTVSSYFTAPSNVAVYVSSYDGVNFGADQSATGISASVSGQTVTVSGFDYTANFVTDKAHTNGTYGQKLVVEYTVGIQSSFFGGNHVPFNGSGCGVYDANGTEVQTVADKAVDVPINYQIAATDKTVYLSQPVDLSRLMTYAADYIPDGANNSFVNITYSLKQNGALVATYVIRAREAVVTSVEPAWAGTGSLAECTPYTLECTVSPALPAAVSGVQDWTDSKEATVHVLEPQINSEDKSIYLSYSAPLNAAVDGWKCGCTVSPKTAQPALTDPVPQYTYYKEGAALTYDAPNTCATYTVSAVLGGRTFENAASFTVHVLKPTLAATDTTIYYGRTTNLDNRVSVTGWKCEHNNTTPNPAATAPVPGYTFKWGTEAVAGKDNFAPEDCVVLTAAWTLAGQSFESEPFTVHVVKPSFGTSDVMVYAGATTDLSDRINVAGENWTCTHGGTLSAAGAPAVTYAFKDSNGGEIPSAYTDCTLVKAHPSVNDMPLPEESFTVHVKKPVFTVSALSVWADCGTSITIADLTGVSALTTTVAWTHSGDTPAPGYGDETPDIAAANTTFQYQVEADEVYTDNDGTMPYTVQEADKTLYVTKVDGSFTFVANGKQQTIRAAYTTPVPFTVHVNTFALSISKTWETGYDVYKQDAIFTVTRTDTGETLQVVIPESETSITIDGLLCGKEYTVSEDSSWTWRWTPDATKTVLHSHDGVSTTAPTQNHPEGVTFTNTLNSDKKLWLDGDAWCENSFGSKQSILSLLGLG